MSDLAAGSRHSDHAVVRQSGLTGIAAGISVLFGLLLDISIAARFGAGAATDSFFVSARIPLGLTAMVMVVANQALVPAFRTSLTNRGEDATHRLISLIVGVVLVAGAAMLLAVWLLADPLMRITAPGISATEASAAASMAPVVFAIVPLVAVSEVMRAYLNSRYRFVVPALMSGILTAVAACVVIVGPFLGWRHDIHMVAFAYLAGAVLQVIFMTVIATLRGMRLRPSIQLRDPHLRSIGRLVVRPTTGAGLNPVARLAEQILVSFLPAGSITILNYGYRLISAIGGTVFFRSVIVALIPRLTEAHNHDDQMTVRHMTGVGMRIMLAISLPLTAFMAALSQPGAIAVFHRGSLTRASAELLGVLLAVYSISLVGSAVQRALLAPFMARLDTRTVLRNTIYGIAANLVLLPLLTLPFGFGNQHAILGVALAYSLAQFVNVGHAWYRLHRTIGWRPVGLAAFSAKVAVASLISGAAMVGAGALLGLDQITDRVILIFLTIGVALLGGVILAAALFVLTGGDLVATLRSLRSLRRARPGRGNARTAGAPAETGAATVEETETSGASASLAEPASTRGSS
ncbi:MAG: lipid II flippase MurJ [Candidatus Dormibacteria bacterium]|jgi:murein biosynthesis integral membrane protein MurJ